MRRPWLALLLALPVSALAQQPAGPAPAQAPAAAPAPQKAEPAKPPPAPAPAPAAAAAPAKAEPTPGKPDPEAETRNQVRSVARYLFQTLILGDARTVASELVFPFQLEDKKYGTPDELVNAWVKQLRTRRTDLVTLYDVEVLSLPEMEKKYGKPPARLGLNLAGQQGYAAVGNLSGHAAIFLFRNTPEGWRAFAYTD